jgi:trimeric autotransporter adhesin
LTNAAEPVTYNWSNGGFTRIVSMLAPGTYTISMTDANSCPATISATIGQPAPFLANAVATPVSAAGLSDGTATANPTSSVGTFFLYAWSTGATTQSISGLSPGNYSVTATDPNGCLTIQTVVVGSACAVVATAVAQNITCKGLINGKATATLANGTAPYTYIWSNGQTTATATGLAAGTYAVTIKDANGCESSASATVIEPTTLNAVLSSVTNVQCPGDPTGGATYTASGGTSPYTYTWSNGSMLQIVSNLLPGSFSVVATDAGGCTKSANGTISVIDTQAPSLACPDNIRRCSGNNVVTFQLPTATDNCNILGGTFGSPTGLPSGSTFPTGVTTQSYTFTDASGNIGSCSFTVSIGTPVSYDGASITDATGAQNNGSIDLTVSGGFAPYTYVWKKNGTIILATTQDLTNIGAGTYSVVISDAIGCSTSSTDIIVDGIIGTSAPTWVSGMKMVPNPTSGAVQIRFASMPKEEVVVTVLDATGRVVANVISNHETTIQLDLTALPAGVYAVRMMSAGEVGVRSLVVE